MQSSCINYSALLCPLDARRTPLGLQQAQITMALENSILYQVLILENSIITIFTSSISITSIVICEPREVEAVCLK